MAIATKDIQSLQNIIEKQEEQDREIAELREANAGLKDEVAKKEADMKDLEVFRPLLDNIPVQYYRIQLRDSGVMKQLFGRMLQMYGKRFKIDPETATDADKKFTRQCLDSTVLACIRYSVTQNSRWNDMVAHYLS